MSSGRSIHQAACPFALQGATLAVSPKVYDGAGKRPTGPGIMESNPVKKRKSVNDAALERATFSAWLTFCGDLYGWILTPEIDHSSGRPGFLPVPDHQRHWPGTYWERGVRNPSTCRHRQGHVMFIPMDAKFSGTCGFLGVSVSRDTKHRPWDRAFFFDCSWDFGGPIALPSSSLWQ